jgi:hypothetical protein
MITAYIILVYFIMLTMFFVAGMVVQSTYDHQVQWLKFVAYRAGAVILLLWLFWCIRP